MRKGKTSLMAASSSVGQPSHPGTCLWHSCRILSLFSVVNTIWSSCWQSSQVREWVNRMVSKRSTIASIAWGFSVKEGVWSFQVHRSLVEKREIDRGGGGGCHPNQEVPECRGREQEMLPPSGFPEQVLWRRSLGRSWRGGKGTLQGSRRF